MVYVVLDLEWNGAFSRKAHGYFNEIIDIGAVKLDENLNELDRFQVMIRPVISKKLSEIVQNLTQIDQEELAEGTTFEEAVARFSEWIGDEEAAILTWSQTDLLVLIEDFQFFYKRPTVPFMTHYADIQRYCQKRMGVDLGQQLGLRNACEQLAISTEGMEIHRALGDSILTMQVLQRVGESESLRLVLQPVNPEFYRRVQFKPTYIKDIHSPLIKRSELRFECPVCGRNLKRKSEFSFRNRGFCADFICNRCDQLYVGRTQFKQTYDGLEVKRRLVEKKPPEVNKKTEGDSHGKEK